MSWPVRSQAGALGFARGAAHRRAERWSNALWIVFSYWEAGSPQSGDALEKAVRKAGSAITAIELTSASATPLPCRDRFAAQDISCSDRR